MRIPCETVVRFNHLLSADHEDAIFRTLRLDNGCLVASDRKYLAVEKLAEPFEGIFHISVDDALIEQCRTEATYHGQLEIIITPALKHAMGKTTFGYTTGQIGVWPDGATAFDRWREVVKQCVEPVKKPSGVMVWELGGLIALFNTSPSGTISFEQMVDVDNRPTVLRDINSPDWAGFFLPRVHDGLYHGPATVPGWLK